MTGAVEEILTYSDAHRRADGTFFWNNLLRCGGVKKDGTPCWSRCIAYNGRCNDHAEGDPHPDLMALPISQQTEMPMQMESDHVHFATHSDVVSQSDVSLKMKELEESTLLNSHKMDELNRNFQLVCQAVQNLQLSVNTIAATASAGAAGASAGAATASAGAATASAATASASVGAGDGTDSALLPQLLENAHTCAVMAVSNRSAVLLSKWNQSYELLRSGKKRPACMAICRDMSRCTNMMTKDKTFDSNVAMTYFEKHSAVPMFCGVHKSWFVLDSRLCVRYCTVCFADDERTCDCNN
jgi:hypothetical protein